MVLPLLPVLVAGKVALVGLATFAGHRAVKRLQRPEDYQAIGPDFWETVSPVSGWKGEGLVYGPKGNVIAREQISARVEWASATEGQVVFEAVGDNWVRGAERVSFCLDGDGGEGQGKTGVFPFVLSGNSCSFSRAVSRPDLMRSLTLQTEEWIFAMSSGNLVYQGVYSRLGVPLGSASFFLTPQAA